MTSTLDDLEIELRQKIDRLSALSSLQQTPGWAHIVEHFENTKKQALNNLLVEQNSSKIIQLQERYRAYNGVLEAVSAAVQEKDKVIQELEDVLIEKQDRDEYARN